MPISLKVKESSDVVTLLSSRFPRFSYIRHLSDPDQPFEHLLVFDKELTENASLWVVDTSRLTAERKKEYLVMFRQSVELDQPSMCRVKGYWNHEGLFFLHTEESTPKTIESVVAEGRLSSKRSLEIAIQVSEYLEYLHQEKIYHTAVSPMSVFIDNEYRVKMGPLHFCRMVIEMFPKEHNKDAYKKFVSLGSNPNHFCERQSDIYALGALICYVSTGYSPDQMPPTRWCHYGLDPVLEEIVSRATCRDGYRLYTHISEIVDSLESIQDSEFGATVSKVCLKSQTHKMRKTQMWSNKTVKLHTVRSENLNIENLQDASVTESGLFNDRYELGECVEYSLLNKVFEAKDTELENRTVWIHLLDHKQCSKFANKFQETVAKLKSLRSNHVCQVFDAQLLDKSAYFATQKETGESLNLFAERHKFSSGDIIDFSNQMVEALIECQAYGFDVLTLSSSNIRVYKHPEGGYYYRILGVGYTTLLGVSDQSEAYYDVMKSPDTLSPELYVDQPHGHKTTQFMLGNIIYKLMVGFHPCDGMSLKEANDFHVTNQPMNIEKNSAWMPESFMNWLAKMINRDHKKRYENLSEVEKDLAVAIRYFEFI